MINNIVHSQNSQKKKLCTPLFDCSGSKEIDTKCLVPLQFELLNTKPIHGTGHLNVLV